jgi:glycosyltransferase involved in cell wall biosynthesis
MRLAFVVYGGLDQISGGFIYDRALVGGLRAIGHEVDVFALPWRGALSAVARNLAFGHPLRRPRDGAAADYDAVVQDELVHPSVALSNRHADAWPRGPALVALVHNLGSGPPNGARSWRARVERRYLCAVDGVIAVCERTLGDVRALADRSVPSVVIRPGRDHVAPEVDEAFALERGRAPGPLRVLFAAAVAPHKGLHRLLAALARAPAGALTLDVVGALPAPRYARALRRQIARLGLGGRVRLHGLRTGAELAALYRQSHVLALPSDREAYSLACLEALGFGLPVLATRVGGLAEMIAPGREGLLLDPEDAAAWSEALVGLARDRAALGAMAGAALARYRAHATWREAAAAAAAFIAARREPAPARAAP